MRKKLPGVAFTSKDSLHFLGCVQRFEGDRKVTHSTAQIFYKAVPLLRNSKKRRKTTADLD